jgi:hypothetical protein
VADPVHVQLSAFRSLDTPGKPVKHPHVMEAIEQRTLCT